MIDRIFAEGVSRADSSVLEHSSPSEFEAGVRAEMRRAFEERGEVVDDQLFELMLADALRNPEARPMGVEAFDAVELAGVPVIAADDVGRYCAALPIGTHIDDLVATMAPPFDRFWIEMQGVPNQFDFHAWGVLVEADESPTKPFPGDDGTPRWVLKLTLLAELRKRSVMGPVGVYVLGLAEDGTWFHHGDGDLYWGGGPPELTAEPPDEVRQEWGDALVPLMFPALMTISFMHCRNVKVDPVTPPPKLSKRHQKRTGRPLVRYHVLDIEPMKRILDAHGATEAGLRKALHICRGHFKVFTEDAPLFGSHVGTYWWAPHVRGGSDDGVVLKDYRVHAPDQLGQEYVKADESERHQTEDSTGQATAKTDPDAAGRGRAAHSRTQNLVAESLRSLGLQPRSPRGNEPPYDLAWEVGDVTHVCEVKSLTEFNEERQLRMAMGQVLRYRQKLNATGRTVQAVIVAERRPTDRSWESLCGLEDIVLTWSEAMPAGLTPKPDGP